jgi:hypothetical protein
MESRNASLVGRSTILLFALPRMMRSIVEGALAAQADLELADGSEGEDVDDAIARTGASVLIVEERAGSEALYRALLLKHPSLKIFILTQEGRNVTLIEFRRVRFVDASPATLVEAIRSELRRETTLDEP